MLIQMEHYFQKTVRECGLKSYQAGDVLNVRLSDGLLKARMKDHTSKLYDIRMDLKTWPQSATHCTCGAHNACEHAAASLYALQYGQKPPSFTPQDAFEAPL